MKINKLNVVEVPYRTFNFSHVVDDVTKAKPDAKVVIIEQGDQAISFTLPQAKTYFSEVGMLGVFVIDNKERFELVGSPDINEHGHFFVNFHNIPPDLKDVNVIALGERDYVTQRTNIFLGEAEKRHLTTVFHVWAIQ